MQKNSPPKNRELSKENHKYVTTVRGQRAISHLWTAARAVRGSKLSDDDKGLIAEAMADIGRAVTR